MNNYCVLHCCTALAGSGCDDLKVGVPGVEPCAAGTNNTRDKLEATLTRSGSSSFLHRWCLPVVQKGEMDASFRLLPQGHCISFWLPSPKLPVEDTLILGGIDGAAARRLPCGKPPVQTMEPARLLTWKAAGGGLSSSKTPRTRITEALWRW